MHRQFAGKLTSPVTKWIVLALFVLALPVTGYFGSKLTEVQNNEMSSWLPEKAESTVAFEKLERFQNTDAIPTAVVYERAGGLTQADLAALQAHAEEFAEMDGVLAGGETQSGVVGPIPSEDGEAAQTIVTFDFGSEGWNAMPDAVAEVKEIAEAEGLTVYITGAGGQAADAAEAFGGIDTTLLFAALTVVIVLLLFAYRSPVLWLLPVFAAVTGLMAAQAVVYALARYADLTVNGQSQGILAVLVIGVSVDYALLLVARYREELRRHEDRHEAMGFALHRASPAIIASALTVAVSMLLLMLADMNSTAGLGPVLAVGVAVGMATMLTLLPALLVISGRWVFWPLRPGFGSHEPTSDGFWAGIGDRIARAPRAVWATTAVLLAVACLGVLRVDASGLSNEDSYTKEFESVTGQQVLAEHGLVDESTPATVVANAERAEAVRTAMADVEGLADPEQPQIFSDVAIIEAALADEPTTQAAFDTVDRLRDAVHDVPGADAAVTGTTAMFHDINEASARDNLVIMPLILVAVLLILIGLLRAVTAPLILMGTVVLSFGAAFGLSWLLFEFVFDHAGMNAGTPLFAFVFLVALGIDYNIFLMTRVREETHARGTRRATRVALAATGGVITSAGLVLAGTFSVLVTLPVVDLLQIGVAVALGIMLDTFIVRSVLVTALNLDLGGKIWWPSSLDRNGNQVSPPDAEPEREAQSALA